MVDSLRVHHPSDVPIFRQIATQLAMLIETGELSAGQALPSARLLAANLRINRHTVARAYSELAARGLVASHGRLGTVVTPGERRTHAEVDLERARAVLAEAVRECTALGLGQRDIESLVAAVVAQAGEREIRTAFVECNADRAQYFAGELAAHLDATVEPLVLGAFTPMQVGADLVITTFFHLAEVRSLFRTHSAEVIAIVVGPHVRALVEIAAVSKDRTVGIWYRNEEQATSIRDSLVAAGITNIVVLRGSAQNVAVDSLPTDGIDVVVIPSDMPDVKAVLEERVRVIEYGNVLDRASVRMVKEVVDELRRTGVSC